MDPNNDAQCAPLPLPLACAALPVAKRSIVAGSTDAMESMLISFTSFLRSGLEYQRESTAPMPSLMMFGPYPGNVEHRPQQPPPVFAEDGLRVELDAVDRQMAVGDPLHDPIGTLGADVQ